MVQMLVVWSFKFQSLIYLQQKCAHVLLKRTQRGTFIKYNIRNTHQINTNQMVTGKGKYKCVNACQQNAN